MITRLQFKFHMVTYSLTDSYSNNNITHCKEVLSVLKLFLLQSPALVHDEPGPQHEEQADGGGAVWQ